MEIMYNIVKGLLDWRVKGKTIERLRRKAKGPKPTKDGQGSQFPLLRILLSNL